MIKRILGATALSLAVVAAHAQTWPTHAVKYIVPFPPGGATDLMSRPLVERLQQRLGQPVVIENIGGAGGSIGATRIAQAKADGYVIGLGNSASHTITPHLLAKPPYDALKDFTPIAMINEYVNILVVNPALGVKNMEEFLALAKSKPGALRYGSAGNGSSNHLTAEVLASQARLKFIHVPYKGNGPALTDVIAGHIDWMFGTISEVLPYLESGKLIALGTSGVARDALLPKVPPIAEAVPKFEVTGFMAVFGPANLPAAVVQRLNTEVNAILKTPEIVERYANAGMKAVGSSPKELEQRVRADHALWKKVIETAGIKAE
ncbi:Bug family tripartite tricarboxylate transporter substrate binding protein [Ottowia thiooxydans]|uniref:Tripartite-type tricarboxylate transporter receptor subunit TctC n=1 Tax=Ottowia thiooxydans TaxID=219182 RepID=A0ABV2QFK2_9BURK